MWPQKAPWTSLKVQWRQQDRVWIPEDDLTVITIIHPTLGLNKWESQSTSFEPEDFWMRNQTSSWPNQKRCLTNWTLKTTLTGTTFTQWLIPTQPKAATESLTFVSVYMTLLFLDLDSPKLCRLKAQILSSTAPWTSHTAWKMQSSRMEKDLMTELKARQEHGGTSGQNPLESFTLSSCCLPLFWK